MIFSGWDKTTPIFTDLIIKLLICRAFSNNINRKPLTAHRLLEKAELLIIYLRETIESSESYPDSYNSINNRKSIRIRNKPSLIQLREGASVIPIDILQ